jgi:hypothetical protein
MPLFIAKAIPGCAYLYRDTVTTWSRGHCAHVNILVRLSLPTRENLSIIDAYDIVTWL